MFFKGQTLFPVGMVGLQSFCGAGQRGRWLCIKENLGIITKVCHSKPKSVDEVNLMGVSCARGRCLAKSPFEKTACFYRSKKWQYLNSLAREWLPDTVPPVLPSAWGLWLCPYPLQHWLQSWVFSLEKTWAGFGLLRAITCTSLCVPAVNLL